jgi:hypothetical protein
MAPPLLPALPSLLAAVDEQAAGQLQLVAVWPELHVSLSLLPALLLLLAPQLLCYYQQLQPWPARALFAVQAFSKLQVRAFGGEFFSCLLRLLYPDRLFTP